MNKDDDIFHLVWTYTIKAVDGREKARCICNGSTLSGIVHVLAKTHNNCVNFMLLLPLGIHLCMALASPTRLLKPHLQNRDFSFSQIVLSMNGGSNIYICHQFHPVMSFQFFLPCRAIQNPHDSGRNTQTKFSEKLGSPQLFMNHASTTLVISADNRFYLRNKLIILPLLC